MSGILNSLWSAATAHPEQVVIAITGAAAIWMVGRKNAWRKWGYLVGLASQPFWLYATWSSQQYGMFALSCWYVYAWAQGYWNNRRAKTLEAAP